MSQANSAARKRRAGGASLDSQSPAQTTSRPGQTQVPGGLTLPQVIAVVDARLIKLETFMKETQQSAGKTQTQMQSTPMPANINSYNAIEKIDANEFDEKFEVLANEIADLKDIVLKLQSYTMEVNKMLMEERITVLSDIDEHVTPKSKEVTFNLTEIEEP